MTELDLNGVIIIRLSIIITVERQVTIDDVETRPGDLELARNVIKINAIGLTEPSRSLC